MLKIEQKGRGSAFNPQNRFETLKLDVLDPSVELPILEQDELPKMETQFFIDHSKSILSKNDSPDLSFTYSINPYRGCEHGCIYCYARPSHEYLSFSSGLDFETKIMVKHNAPELLEKELQKKSFTPQPIILSGNTDCYQPVERKLGITRKLLEVFLKYRNPVAIITKNALVRRDIDILKQLAELELVIVTVSITTLDNKLKVLMEPRTSSPQKRLDTVEELSKAGIPVNVNIAPVIPALNDHEIPEMLKQVSERGAKSAAKVVLRLPYANKDLFVDWVKTNFPMRADKILNRIRGLRGGKLNDSSWSVRMKGEGEWANTLDTIFKTYSAKYGLIKPGFHLSTQHFTRTPHGQMELF